MIASVTMDIVKVIHKSNREIKGPWSEKRIEYKVIIWYDSFNYIHFVLYKRNFNKIV